MKKRSLILLVSLLLAAAVLGWFLPTAVFHGVDQGLEGKPEPASIRQIDLSYQSDLQIEDRLRLIREYNLASSATALERGVYQDAEKVREILEAFLQQLTGIQYTMTEQNCDVQPALLRFDEEGVFVVWSATVFLNEAWGLQAILDDQTGLILRCEFESMTQQWDRLFPSFYEVESSEVFLNNSLQETIRQHYQTQLSASYTATVMADDSDGNACPGYVILYENNQEAFHIPFLFVLSDGVFQIGS